MPPRNGYRLLAVPFMSGRRPRDRELRKAKNAVRGAFNVPKASYLELQKHYGRAKLSTSDLVFGGLSQLPAGDAEAFLAWLNGFPAKALQLYPKKPIEDQYDLRIVDVKVPMPLIARLYWLSIFLEQSHSELATFVKLSAAFEQEFLSGRFADAQGVLDAVKEQFGVSVWLIENQIGLLQRWKGLEAQKEYSRPISDKARGRLAGVTAFYVSQRNEENTVYTRYRNRLARAIEDWKVKEPTKDAYAFILGVKRLDEFSDVRASAVVGVLAMVSLVDAYWALIAGLETLICHPRNSEVLVGLGAVVARLPAEDFRVMKIAAVISGDFSGLPRASTAVADCVVREGELVSPPTEVDACALLDRAFAECHPRRTYRAQLA